MKPGGSGRGGYVQLPELIEIENTVRETMGSETR
jgi:hypothetical protein